MVNAAVHAEFVPAGKLRRRNNASHKHRNNISIRINDNKEDETVLRPALAHITHNGPSKVSGSVVDMDNAIRRK